VGSCKYGVLNATCKSRVGVRLGNYQWCGGLERVSYIKKPTGFQPQNEIKIELTASSSSCLRSSDQNR